MATNKVINEVNRENTLNGVKEVATQLSEKLVNEVLASANGAKVFGLLIKTNKNLIAFDGTVGVSFTNRETGKLMPDKGCYALTEKALSNTDLQVGSFALLRVDAKGKIKDAEFVGSLKKLATNSVSAFFESVNKIKNNKVVCYEKSGLSLSDIKSLVATSTISDVITAIETAISTSKEKEEKEAKTSKKAKAA